MFAAAAQLCWWCSLESFPLQSCNLQRSTPVVSHTRRRHLLKLYTFSIHELFQMGVIILAMHEKVQRCDAMFSLCLLLASLLHSAESADKTAHVRPFQKMGTSHGSTVLDFKVFFSSEVPWIGQFGQHCCCCLCTPQL